MLTCPASAQQVVDISRLQMDQLCGNVLELEDGRGHPVLALSSQVNVAIHVRCLSASCTQSRVWIRTGSK